MINNLPDDYSELEKSHAVRTVQRSNRMILCVALLVIGMLGAVVAIPAVLLTNKTILINNSAENEVVASPGDFPFVTRSEWGARRAKEVLPLSTPVPYVVIHHSFTPPACYNRKQCDGAMKSMQNFHMDERGWWDIGYNFAVGCDGVAYEGRGWTILGAHALHFNTVSIGICLIGDWSDSSPPPEQLKTAKALIAAGVEHGFIKSDYKLVGHRQVRDTECPGQSLFDIIKTWDHWSAFPASSRDLLNVPDISDDEKKKLVKPTL